MTKRMLIDAAHADETRVALLEYDQVYDYDFVSSSKTQIKGNIYLAKITRVEPSLQAAFVEYGTGKQGFLPFSEIHPDYYQLPQSDKQKLLEEQIAEAEAEEAAEDAAFEREQAAREARRGRGESTESDAEYEEFNREDTAAEDALASSAAIASYSADDAGDATTLDALPPVAEVEIPESYATNVHPMEEVQPLNAESFAVYSENLPEEAAPAFDDALRVTDENTVADETDTSNETSAEDGEEVHSRGGRERSLQRRYRIQEVIKRNQIVLVQVIKEERGNKGASLTTFISLAGRAAVLMPNSPKGGGISRKITDRETRKRLKEVASEMRTHRGMSVIIRTAGIDRTKDEIRRDFEYLVTVWNTVRTQTLAATAPALIYEEGNLIKRSLRDLYTSDVSEVLVEGEDAFNEAKAFMNMLMPNHLDRIKQYTGTMPLFSHAGVDDQLAAMAEPQVRLPSGGYLVIHPTEALISIDVNSGRSTTERNVEETAIKTNLEAAYEVARQLRLRDLAGLIVVDFIDMGYGKNRKAVERAMKDALKADRAKIQVGRISMFGLMELSRQRLRPSISESMGILCPHCKGTGYIHSVETVGIQIIRTLEREAASAQYATLRVTTHPEAALYLLNEKRGALQALEQRYNVTVVVAMDTALIAGNHRLVKVTLDGREILHEPAQSQNKHRGGKPRRGRRGGREESGNVIHFNANAGNDGDENTSAEPREGGEDAAASGESSPRGERSGRRERGGRNRGRDRDRNRNRGPRPEGQEAVAAENAAPAEGQSAEGAEQQPATDADGNRERNRRRGRRGGRNRNRERGERRPSGDGVEASASPEATAPREESSYSAPRQTPAPEAQKSFVIPLSEAQTNPAAVASPIRTESSGGDDKNKRKGWWSRVLES